MLRLVMVAFVSAVMAVAALFTGAPEAAHACSCPDSDVLRDYDTIVGGRVVSWSLPEGVAAPGSYSVVNLEFRTTQVFKGDAADSLVLVDTGSYFANGSTNYWMGSGGACGTLHGDPTGAYFIAGLRPLPDGRFSISRFAMVFIGPEPEGDWYDRALTRLSVVGPPRPPAAGNSGPVDHADARIEPLLLGGLFVGGGLLLIFVVVLIGPRNDGL